MTNFIRWAIPGFALGVLLSLSPSCGPQKARCTPANCAGCCDATGTCNQGNNGQACGVSGELCRTCNTNETCSLGRCNPLGGTGGGVGGGTGGGAGGGVGGGSGGGQGDGGMTCAQFASNCGAGTCCKMSGGTPTCVGAGSNLDCRNTAGVCEICTGSQTCGSTGCASTSCSGCQGTTGCIPTNQQNATACGLNGAACISCPGGGACVNGVCTGGTGGGAGGGTGGGTGGGAGGGGGGTCDTSNCSQGCCSNGQCLGFGLQSGLSCGTNANTCSACPTGNSCVNGVCVPPTTCNSSNCAQGCCTTGGCIPWAQQNNSTCGTGGNTCAACPTGNCNGSGVCQATGTGAIGVSCTNSSGCTALGTGAICKLTTPTNVPWQGGYCTKPCSVDTECSAITPGAVCGTPPTGLAYGESTTQKLCWSSCGPAFDQCRSGYNCFYSVPGTGTNRPTGCWLEPVAPATWAGKACTTQAECGPPPAYSFCVTATLSDGGSSGWTGGSCLAQDCYYANSADFCGTSGLCLDYGDDGTGYHESYCFQKCSGPNQGQSNCRPGYVCWRTGGVDGFCQPNCNNSAGFCGAGYACRPNGGPNAGYCCPTDGGACPP